MAMSLAQRTMFNKATKMGSGKQAVTLTDDACRALVAIAARDLHVLPDLAALADGLDLYSAEAPSLLGVQAGGTPISMYEKLVQAVADGDTYFASLAALHKGRLKYERILATQPIPTIEQVGPRGLLLYGLMPTDSLAALLLWRKWVFDIDNRAGQETGYVFEPILAGSIGGVAVSSSKSPVRRRTDKSKGRQVDCVLGNVAYEFKLRVTIAASGQGRWGEELDFPLDCVASGFVPALVVLDSTEDPKLTQLIKAFRDAGGQAYVGPEAWNHLEQQAGPTMGVFVEQYIRRPLADLLEHVPEVDDLPPFGLRLENGWVVFRVGEHEAAFQRLVEDPDLDDGEDDLPDDAGDQLPGI